MKRQLLTLSLSLLSFLVATAQTGESQEKSTVDTSLARHDFFYTGQSKQRRMFIVKDGQVTWSYNDHLKRGEISDAVLMTNGHILVAHQYGVAEVTQESETVWQYTAPEGTEIHTIQPIGRHHVVFVQNGKPAKVVVMEIPDCCIVREFQIPYNEKGSVHGQFRNARLTSRGTLLIANMAMGCIHEYNSNGQEVDRWGGYGGASSAREGGFLPWSVQELPKTGNLLITGRKGLIQEINRQGHVVWQMNTAPLGITQPQKTVRLKNGHHLVNNWYNEWNKTPMDSLHAPVQAVEIDKDGKIVWQLCSWRNPDLGPSTTIQLLSEAVNRNRLFFGEYNAQKPKLFLGPNEPVGEGRGIHPGRVAWIHSPGVAKWDGHTGLWVEDRWNDQAKADAMIPEAVIQLTGESTAKKAWQALFRHFNKEHGRGNRGYKKGETITIKLNLNNAITHHDTIELNSSPFTTLALVRSLVQDGGVREQDIILCEPSRAITDSIYNKVHCAFPAVRFIDNIGGDGREKCEYYKEQIVYSVDNGKMARGLAKCVVDADYLINSALLKTHSGPGVTLTSKNWYGATDINLLWRQNAHNNVSQDKRHGKPNYKTFVDWMSHKDMGQKALLFLIDGTYGSRDVNGAPNPKWMKEPFNGDWACSLIVSQDEVACDAVAMDIIIGEWPEFGSLNYCDEYLREAATIPHTPSGTIYKQDGQPLTKPLGLMEHWNNQRERKYTKIDLKYKKMDDAPAMQTSLNGTWQLKVVPGITENTAVPAQDASWRDIPVPGCWEAYGFCEARYDRSDSLTGYYRTSFTVPREWAGQRIMLRFDGVLYGYDLWINDRQAGAWRSGYNTALFDITDYINRKSDTQQLAMRVITRFPGSDFDYNDDWAPSGIFRDVTLMAVPQTHVSDLTIHTENTGVVRVTSEIANPAKDVTLRHEILDARGLVISTANESVKGLSVMSELTVDDPLLWTAETPHLYTLRTTLSRGGRPQQTLSQRFGFRQLTIDGNVLKLNGQPIKLRGVTCHSTDPRTLKVVSDELTLRDMQLMKEASVNYIRTSHYPREPRFYELADSLGFYVISEVPFGYGDKNLSKEAFYPMLQQRAEATIRRDKNHPSVLIWSLGNENPLTDITIRLGDYVHASLDSVRPYCYPQVGSYFRRFWEKSSDNPFPSAAPIYAPHYPTTGQIGGFYQHLDRPVIFTEYCHTLGISFEDHDRQWEIIQRTPGIAGGSVWEWVDQGAPFMSEKKKETAEDRRFSGYEEKVYTSEDAGFQMFGNKGTDGLLYADRTPLPNYYELQHNYARAFVAAVDSVPQRLMVNGQWSMFNVRCTNRYDFLNLKDNVTIAWALSNDLDTIARGACSPACKPHESVDYPLSLPAQTLASDSTLVVLHFALSDVQGHRFLQQSFVLQKPKVEWGGTGRVTDCLQTEPMVRAGRKATLAESVTQKGRLPRHYLLPLSNTEVACTLDRQPFDGGEHVSFTLQPDSADVFRAELGLAYLLDASIDRVQWIGQGPFASYPGRHQACRYGLWAKQMGDLYFEGNHGGVDAALLTDAAGNGLLVTGDSLDLNFEQTDRGLVLTVNAGVSGQGPKFRRTAFPIEAKTPTARFTVYRVEAGRWPSALRRLFRQPSVVPSPFRPFLTQYDTYLNRFDDIFGKTEKEK